MPDRSNPKLGKNAEARIGQFLSTESGSWVSRILRSPEFLQGLCPSARAAVLEGLKDPPGLAA